MRTGSSLAIGLETFREFEIRGDTDGHSRHRKGSGSTRPEIDNIELYKQILELQSEAIKMVEDNVGLRTQVKALEDRLKTKETLLFEDNSYWIQRAVLKEGPFCSLCWDKDDKLVRKHLDTTKRWYCPTHETENHPFSVA